MKQLFSLILLVSSILPLSTNASSGTLEKSNASFTKNSDPEVVATLSDRDAIPLGFRAERMYCYVADNHKVYQLRGGVTNAHWVELDIASSMKIQGPAGSLPYIDATGLLATDLRYLGKAKYDYSGANTLGSGQYVNVNGINNIVNDRSHNLINAYNSFSDGNYVMIVGENDSALGKNGTILGDDITLNADQQFAAGKGLVGLTASEVLFGQYNQFIGSANNQWLGTDRLLTLGNGSSANNRSNALVVYKNGDAVFSGNVAAANLYTKLQIDSMFVAKSVGGGTGIVQSLNLSGTSLTITGSNTVNFAGWDINAADDFSGDYNDLSNKPALFSGDYNDLTNKPISFSGDYNDLTNLPDFSGWDTDASDDFSGDFTDLTNTPNFSNWDQNAADDFSGDYNALTNKPTLFSGDYNDLTNKPLIFSGDYNDLTNLPDFSGWDTDASDDFSGDFTDLTNTPNFSNWDQNAADDFSGDYNALTNKPTLFSGDYNDLTNKPLIFSGDYNDLINTPSFAGWDTDASDDFSGDFADLTNTPNFSNWDQNAADDFSGDYNALTNKPALFSGDYNDLLNTPSFAGWDTDASDDFSGYYKDLINSPDVYLKTQVDSAITFKINGATTQILNLNGTKLDISGGNSVNFIGWDTDASDDFTGDYNDLSNLPTLFSGNYNDLANKPSLFSGNYNDLNNKPSFNNWDMNALDDFSGDYLDLVNKPNFTGWDTDVSDDFSGNYNDLTNKPAIFSGDYNDLINTPSFVGWDMDASDDFNGDYNALTNLPSFAGWDTDASDDFTGDYNALTNKPVLFSGNYNDLSNIPSVYSKVQIDSMFVVNGSGSGSGSMQNLNLSGNQLTITGGNTVNFSSWDTDASDDFSGDYNDLSNKPVLFNGDYNSLSNLPKLFDGDYNKLSNAPSLVGWDTDVSDDFSGDYTDLTNIPADFQDGKISWTEVDSRPDIYTQSQVDSIKVSIVDSMTAYVDSAVISQAAKELVVNRNMVIGDVGNTIYVKANTNILTIPSGSNIPFNAHIELRDFGSGTFILDASAITLLDNQGNVISNTSSIVVHDVAITAVGNDEYKIIGLYQ